MKVELLTGYFVFMSPRNRKTNLYGLVVGVGCLILLVACQPPKTPVQTADSQSSGQVIAAAPPEQADEPDIVGALIVRVEEKKLKVEDDFDTSAAERPAVSLPDDNDERSRLAEEALNAALGLLKTKQPQILPPLQPFDLPEKKDVELRVGFLLPLSGDFEALGKDIAGGAEMALFQLQDPQIDIVFFDTEGGVKAEQAARQAVASDVDIVVGPLFTQAVQKARPIFAASSIPVIALSNNIRSASPGNWVLGYLPEQQIDHLLGYAIGKNKIRIAILASEDPFGQQILEHAVSRLAQFGIQPVQISMLSPAALADEDSLKDAIKIFSRYIKPENHEDPLPEPAYDVLILAGQPDFILRTAPVLAFYDLDPKRVTYLGTDLWARTDLVTEPSLQGSIITQAKLPPSEGFEKQWRSVFKTPSNTLARLGFDAFALIAVTKQEMKQKAESSALAQSQKRTIDWWTSLIRAQGFQGFSGQFNFLPDGRNQRQYELFYIRNNKVIPFQP